MSQRSRETSATKLAQRALGQEFDDPAIGSSWTPTLWVVVAFLLWITWPVWLLPLASVGAMLLARRTRQGMSDGGNRVLYCVEQGCLALAVLAGAFLLLHLGVVVYDWWVTGY